MKLLSLFVFALVAATSQAQAGQRTDALIGAGVGGAGGAWLGSELGGQGGAIVGGGLGAAAGTYLSTDRDYDDDDRGERRSKAYRRGGPPYGNAWGHYKK